MTTERWAFSESELANPAKCKSYDELLADVPYEYAEEHGIEEDIIVQRNGTVTNRWSDGTAGVPAETAELAGECETLYRPETREETDAWRDVEVDAAGNFLRLLPAGC